MITHIQELTNCIEFSIKNDSYVIVYTKQRISVTHNNYCGGELECSVVFYPDKTCMKPDNGEILQQRVLLNDHKASFDFVFNRTTCALLQLISIKVVDYYGMQYFSQPFAILHKKSQLLENNKVIQLFATCANNPNNFEFSGMAIPPEKELALRIANHRDNALFIKFTRLPNNMIILGRKEMEKIVTLPATISEQHIQANFLRDGVIINAIGDSQVGICVPLNGYYKITNECEALLSTLKININCSTIKIDGKLIEIVDGLTIGRGEQATIRLENIKTLAKIHARFEIKNNETYLVNLSESNFTAMILPASISYLISQQTELIIGCNKVRVDVDFDPTPEII